MFDSGKEKSQEAEAEGDKLITEAEEKGQQLRDEAAKAAEKIRKEADAECPEADNRGINKRCYCKTWSSERAADALRKEADKKATQLTVKQRYRPTSWSKRRKQKRKS